jgi:hypothetical protein
MKRLLVGLVCSALLAPAAMAQTADSLSGAQSFSSSKAASNSVAAGVGTGGTSSLSYSSTVTNTIPRNTTATIHNTPDVGLPGLFGGTNPCTVGATGGLSLAGVGVGLGGQWAAAGCERRNASVILFQANMPDVAVALLCQDDQIRTAFREVGKPCPADRAETTAAAAAAPAPVAMAPTPAPAQVQQQQPMPVAAVQTQTTAAGKPAWCSTSSPGTGADRTTYDYYCR